MRAVDVKDLDQVAKLTEEGRRITLDLTKKGLHPRDQIAIHLVAMSMAMAAGLADDITDEEVSEMLHSIIPETVAMFRQNKESFTAFKKKFGG